MLTAITTIKVITTANNNRADWREVFSNKTLLESFHATLFVILSLI
ncbi:hypothetical protein J2X31_001796 [Flavobacterium arsenatis]|uniref:Uncharacterized protein n=1 Tax=Flavobacterium arsenatis TaxID=1484332 RepID=A0ABU1TPC2_9FLAO|nr:hypothetical protein [Flavobacterium arsenatis]